jgi:hypothetical protein
MIERPHLWLMDPVPDPGGPKTRGSGFGSATLDSRVHKTTYAPMIYTAQCVMFLMRADTLRGEVFWAPNTDKQIICSIIKKQKCFIDN